MILEVTIQFRVSNYKEGQQYYSSIFQKNPDFVPHEGFAEWEVIPGCWLQIAEGEPAGENGPLRLGVPNLDKERNRLVKECNVDKFEIYTRNEVPVKWATFSDPWGNKIGLFEYINKTEEAKLQNRLRLLERKL
jgi:hypothetical protein